MYIHNVKSGNRNVDNIIHNVAQNKKKENHQNIASNIINGNIVDASPHTHKHKHTHTNTHTYTHTHKCELELDVCQSFISGHYALLKHLTHVGLLQKKTVVADWAIMLSKYK